ncbi:M48 family metalloprotease [Nitrospira calida]|jgi:hypothetical protein
MQKRTRLEVLIAAFSWVALTIWAFAPSRISDPPAMPLWMALAFPPLHLAIAGFLYACATPLPPDAAWPARLRVIAWRSGQRALRARSFGGGLVPVVLIAGPWTHQPAEIRRALLAHEAGHLLGWHMLWLPTLGLALVTLLPTSFGSVLLAWAICATINRRLELDADRRAAGLAGAAAARAMLAVVGEDRGWPQLRRVPILCLLLTHPPLNERLAALSRAG